MINLILCGGSGTRLWPLSRKKLPKQYTKLFGGKSLFEENIIRNAPLCNRVMVATNIEHLPLIKEQLKELDSERLDTAEVGGLIEPVGRNTAPAIALVLLSLQDGLHDEEVVLITPSDHRISNQAEYARAVQRAEQLALQGYLVTFGIKPSYAETGYGYIESDGEEVLSFKEKPDRATAERYLASGGYYWNSGMFVFKARTFLEELAYYAPEVYDAALQAYKRAQKGSLLIPSLEDMQAIPAISLDYAVMEKSKRVKVVPCDPGWSDLGSFDALYDESLGIADKENAVMADDAILVNSKRCLVVGKEKPIVLDGVEDLIVVQTEDATLIMRRGQSQDVRQVLKIMERDRPELL